VPVTVAYLGLAVFFGWVVAQFYIPEQGFSYFIAFGNKQQSRYLDEVLLQRPYIERDSWGYDAQFYAQMALHPTLRDPRLKTAIDSLAYRGRRILFVASAYLAGLGKPAWILQAFALQNVVCWFLLAGLLLHWFPPTHWENLLRWAGVLFSSGACFSVHDALFDLPSLLLIAFAVYLLELGRPWWLAAILGLAGLGKESNLIGATVLLPARDSGWRGWLVALGRGVVVLLPLALWTGYLYLRVSPEVGAGHGNFSPPFVGYGHKIREMWAKASVVWPDAPTLVRLVVTVHLGFRAARPRWQDAWWRLGATFAVLMVFLGDAVWEGIPSAAGRVLLPMQLAFNILVPAGRWWRVLLIFGNLSLVSSPDLFDQPAREVFTIYGPQELCFEPGVGDATREMGPEWSGTERKFSRVWSWAPGTAVIRLQNPHPADVESDLTLGLGAVEPRTLQISLNGQEVWSGPIGRKVVPFTVTGLVLHPGVNQLVFHSDAPPTRLRSDPRDLAFSLYNARLDLRRFRPGPPP
jgi:hypothetical protein